MKPLDWLRVKTRQQRKPVADLQRVAPLVVRALAAAPPKPEPPRTVPWTNPVRTVGACTHDVIYSRCNCEASNIRAQTNAAEFHPEQRR